MKEGLHNGEKKGMFYHAHLHDLQSPPQTRSIIDVLSATSIGKKEAIVSIGSITFRMSVAHVVRNHDDTHHSAWNIYLRAVKEQQ